MTLRNRGVCNVANVCCREYHLVS